MKTLYIIRHGKSSWEEARQRDHDRILLPKGVKRTLKIGNFLKSRNIQADLIISSSANRAYETAAIIAGVIDYPLNKIDKQASFYNAEDSTILDHLFSIDNEINSVMIFGHNPTFTNLANIFLGDIIDWMPTTAVLSINFATHKWEDLMLADKKKNFLVTPKML
jgi:phosphohistidine phosphatase